MYMLYYYIYYLCIVKLVTVITSASAYIHNKHHLLLTCDWLEYICCIVDASHNGPIINIAQSPFFWQKQTYMIYDGDLCVDVKH